MRVRLQQMRKTKGYTQQSFSQAVGISRSHYSQVETGAKYPSFRLAMRIKKILCYYGDDIFDDIRR